MPKDVFVLHGRTKAKVADQSQSNTEWFNLPDKVWGNIAATYETAMEMIIIPGLTLVTHSAVLLELSMLLII